MVTAMSPLTWTTTDQQVPAPTQQRVKVSIEALTGFSHILHPDTSTSHYYLKAVFWGSFCQQGRQMEYTVQGRGTEWGASDWPGSS